MYDPLINVSDAIEYRLTSCSPPKEDFRDISLIGPDRVA